MTVSNFFQDTLFYSPAGLTTATTTDPLQVAVQDLAACSNFVFQITVANIGTNVVVRAEGSLDGTNYFNLGSGDTTISGNGTTKLTFADIPVKYVRGRLVSISTGTPTVTFVISAL
ncbi:MAG: hypothetical protein ACO3I1_05185 [Burkholderiales bacterium]